MSKYACSTGLTYLFLHTPAVCDLCEIEAWHHDVHFKGMPPVLKQTPALSMVGSAANYDHCRQTWRNSTTPNGAETAHTQTANSQSHSRTYAQTNTTANASQVTQLKIPHWAVQQWTRELSISDAHPETTFTQTLQHLVPNDSCRKPCRDRNMPNPVSQYWYCSATNRWVRTQNLPRCYDVRTPYPQTRTGEQSLSTSFQGPFSSKHKQLFQCCKLSDFGCKIPNCSRHTPFHENSADQTIPRTSSHSHDIPTAVHCPTHLAQS